MNMDDADYNRLLARVKKLEGRNRFWNGMVLLILLIIGMSLTANVKAQQGSQAALVRATIVEAQTFALRDHSGRVMGQLMVKDGKPMLELYDAAGKVTWSSKTQAIASVGR